MATVAEASRPRMARDASGAVEPRRARPVIWWATLGIAFFAVEAAALIGWIASGDAKRTPNGPTPIPTWMQAGMRVWEIVGVFAMVGVLYFFLIRPWRREGRITLDGLFCLVFLFTVFWQDTLSNYFQVWNTYNTGFINFGSWYLHVPGWLSPRANLIAEPPVWVIPVYVYVGFGGAVVGCWVMRKAKALWPRLGTLGLIVICFGFFAVVDVFLEPMFLRLGFYVYPGAIEWLTIFHGEYYQYPVYAAPLFGMWLTGFTCCRYFRNDKGQTIAERGLDRVRLAGKKKTTLRFLALSGACNLSFLVCYNLPTAIAAIYSSSWPEDIIDRSYLNDGICGPGTTYACPGPGTPINRPDSAHVTPEGTLVIPGRPEP